MNSISLSDLSARLPTLEQLRQERARRSSSEALAGTVEESRERCRGLVGFIREAWHLVVPGQPYVHNWHIDLLARHLEAISHGGFMAKGLDNRLIANIPPGAMKSLILMVFWPAWEWGPDGRPGMQYLCTSYKLEHCERDSDRFRTIVESGWFQSRWPITIRRSSLDYVENEARGNRRSVPFGALMGHRADRLLVDDPHSLDGAESEADRERAVRNFRETGILRLNDPKTSAICIIMQRLHQADLSGMILDHKFPYVHVMLPMRFDPARKCVTPFGSDPRTTPGELLFRERFSLEVVSRDEAVMGSVAVAGQMDQRPTPRGGLLFKRHHFKIVQAAPAGCRWVAAWDLAASEKKSAAYTCRVLMGYQARDRQYFIRHVVRDRVSNPEPMIVRVARQDTEMVGPHEISIPKDPGAAGLVQARSIIGALPEYQAYATPESGDKYGRAQPVAAQAEAGNVCLVEGPWTSILLDEAEVFPRGAFKDQIDAMSRAYGHLLTRQGSGMGLAVVASAPRAAFGDHPGE